MFWVWLNIFFQIRPKLTSCIDLFKLVSTFFYRITKKLTQYIFSAPSSHHQVGSKSLKVMKQKSVGSNESPSGVSLLRQQLQGTLCSTKYKKAQETICKDCNQPFTTKCLLQVCRKSDEVLCQRCGQELTAKCLLQSCSERPQNSFWTKLELTSKWIISNFKWPLSKFIKA